MGTAILWFRRDLRLEDNPALLAAARHHRILPVFIWDPAGEAPWAPGAASRWWLHRALHGLGQALAARGAPLLIVQGDSARVLDTLIRQVGAEAVYWNRLYEPTVWARDAALAERLEERGVRVVTFNASLLNEPGQVRKGDGGSYLVFTSYHKAALALPVEKPAPAPPARLAGLTPDELPGLALGELGLRPKVPWDREFPQAWPERSWSAELPAAARGYGELRDRPSVKGTSELSPYLHWGQLGPRQVHAMIASNQPQEGVRASALLRQLYWREFAHDLLFHYPTMDREPLRREYASFPYVEPDGLLAAWQKGQTGYPLVDAGLRQLWRTGWMHNRVRMIVGSFLVKHLLLPWQEGARWFWDTLLDADLANNSLGWQWIAGCGVDAAPYFRIFNPVLQGEKFDPEGDYVRRWVPELARLEARYVHKPWAAPASVLRVAGVVLDRTYPAPIVDHERARFRALHAYELMRRRAKDGPASQATASAAMSGADSEAAASNRSAGRRARRR